MRRNSASHALIIAAVAAASSPGVAVPSTVRGGVTVWLPYWTMQAAYASAVAHAGVIGTASPFWYAISGDSTVGPYPGAGDPAITGGLRARGIAVVPTVTESDRLRAFDGVLASPRRSSPAIAPTAGWITTWQATQVAAQYGAGPTWDTAQEEATYRYGSRRHRHTVWYEDARSEYTRARLAVAMGFAGVDLWAAGGEDPAVWPLLRGLFGHS